MDYKKLLKSELLELVFKLENENKEAVAEFQKEIEGRTVKEFDLKKRLGEYMKSHDDLGMKLNDLNGIFSMLILSLLKMNEDYEHGLSRAQEDIILVSDSFRSRIIGK